MKLFNSNVAAFVLSIFITGSEADGSSEPSAISNIVEFTVANLDPNDDGASNKFRVQLRPSWAPIGVERFQELTSSNFWGDIRIFRNVPNFMSQFGISSDPAVQASWSSRGNIQDDAVVTSNSRGTVTFATAGANSRTTQIFINTADNSFLDRQGFSPIGEVLPAGDGYGGMEVVDKFYSEYGESPDQGKITNEGVSYLNAQFPDLSYFEKAEFIAGGSHFQEEA